MFGTSVSFIAFVAMTASCSSLAPLPLGDYFRKNSPPPSMAAMYMHISYNYHTSNSYRRIPETKIQ